MMDWNPGPYSREALENKTTVQSRARQVEAVTGRVRVSSERRKQGKCAGCAQTDSLLGLFNIISMFQH